MSDLGHELTDKKLRALEKQIAAEYRQANRECVEKMQAYLEKTEEQRKAQKALLDAGKITRKEYRDWCFRHEMVGQRWQQMCNTLAEDYHNTNEIARRIAAGEMADIYALNANFATYQIEHDGNIDTSFTLYNHDTAEYLLKDEREMMPGPSTRKQREIAANKDLQWNRQKIQSAVLQGVLQGESAYKVAARLRSVGQMNYNASVRYARTMTTNTQNAGRYEAFRRAKRLGVDLTIEWQATLDGRTRHEHRMMHGQRREVDEAFEVSGVKILWPAQTKFGSSNIPQELIWNCRCTLLSWVKGFEGETVKSSPKMGGMSFEEWQNAKPRRESSDREQYERYKDVLGKKAPETFEEFENIKYDQPSLWNDLKSIFRKTSNEQRKTEQKSKAYTVKDCKVRTEKYAFGDGTWTGVRKIADATIYTTPDGIDFVFPVKYNDNHQKLTIEQALRAFNRVPEEIRKRGQRTIIVQDVYNPQDAYWRKHYKTFSGSYMTGGKEITFWRWDYEHDDDYLVRAYAHEMAHYIDVGGNFTSGSSISGTNLWADAMTKDANMHGRASPTQYGENSAGEDFAESFAEFTNDRLKFEIDFPYRSAVIKSILGMR